MKGIKGGEAGRKKKSEKSSKGGGKKKKKLAQSHLEGTEKVFVRWRERKPKAIMYPRDALLVGMEYVSGKGGTVASGFSLFQQLGGWHLNLNCWVSSGVCVCVCVCARARARACSFVSLHRGLMVKTIKPLCFLKKNSDAGKGETK